MDRCLRKVAEKWIWLTQAQQRRCDFAGACKSSVHTIAGWTGPVEAPILAYWFQQTSRTYIRLEGPLSQDLLHLDRDSPAPARRITALCKTAYRHCLASWRWTGYTDILQLRFRNLKRFPVLYGLSLEIFENLPNYFLISWRCYRKQNVIIVTRQFWWMTRDIF